MEALKDGYRLIDTANAYVNEKAVGRAMKKSGLAREDIFQEKELKEFLEKEEIKIQAWYPLGHGDSALLEEAALVELGKKYQKSTAQIILRWHIQDGNIVIPGSKNPEHIKDNFDLFDFKLTDAEMDKIRGLDKNKRYYTSTPELLASYAKMVPPVDEQ